MLKFSGTLVWRLGNRSCLRQFTSPTVTVLRIDKQLSSSKVATETVPEKSLDESGLVAAAFAALNAPDTEERKPSPKSFKQNRIQILDAQIKNAETIEDLLKVAESAIVFRRHALKMVAILSDWWSTNKVKLSDFEKDPRFLKLCRILARTATTPAASIGMADDLSTVLGITGDDEAARMISKLSLPQLIKVMRALHQKGRRSTPLLRALSHSIVNQTDAIDLKKSADILFSMAALNFPDPVLLDRICGDVIKELPHNEDKPAVVNSIVTSLGLMRYRHEQCLAAAVGWLQSHAARSMDLATATVTLATLNYVPIGSETLFEAVQALKEEDLARPSSWLDLVFSLVILDRVSERHMASTLSAEFIDKLLAAGEIPITSRRKLMTIDAYAALRFPSYAGPKLPEHISVGVPIVYTKEKTLYVQSIMDSFKNLISSESFIKKGCNSNMGFLYDAEFVLDSKCHPVSLEKAENDKSVFRIAVLGLDYHDICRKVPEPLGVYQLYTRLLQMKGYKVLQIPYTEYNPKEKLVTRVQYIQQQMQQIINDDSVKQS